jgi:predicted GNAT family acetyltransferase
MRVLEFSDAHSFLERAREFLFNDEIRHNLLLSSVLTLSKTFHRAPSLVFLATEGGVALRAPNQRWILSTETEESASRLASRILQSPFRSLLVPAEHAGVFPTAQTTTALQNFMSLSKLSRIEPSAGLLRLASNQKDLKLLVGWSRAFATEAGLDETPKEAEDSIVKYAAGKQLYVWENGGRPVAMAAIGGFTPRTARISMVYTDPAGRGKGHASTLVHRLSHKLLQDGRSCVLFADAANMKTKSIYERLGYRTVTRFAELKSLATARPAPASPRPGSDPTPASASR